MLKVERPGSGADPRAWGPPWQGQGADRAATCFLSANQDRRSAAIDIARQDGNAQLREPTRYGLDATSLQPLNPRLIHGSITSYGQGRPLQHKTNHDFLIQSEGGLMAG